MENIQTAGVRVAPILGIAQVVNWFNTKKITPLFFLSLTTIQLCHHSQIQSPPTIDHSSPTRRGFVIQTNLGCWAVVDVSIGSR